MLRGGFELSWYAAQVASALPGTEPPCHAFTEKGFCKRGLTCPYSHNRATPRGGVVPAAQAQVSIAGVGRAHQDTELPWVVGVVSALAKTNRRVG